MQVVVFALPLGSFFPTVPKALFDGGFIDREPQNQSRNEHDQKNKRKGGHHGLPNGRWQPQVKMPIQDKMEKTLFHILQLLDFPSVRIQIDDVVVGGFIVVKNGFRSFVFAIVFDGMELPLGQLLFGNGRQLGREQEIGCLWFDSLIVLSGVFNFVFEGVQTAGDGHDKHH